MTMAYYYGSRRFFGVTFAIPLYKIWHRGRAFNLFGSRECH
jgi:hypothetical protein